MPLQRKHPGTVTESVHILYRTKPNNTYRICVAEIVNN